MLLTQGVPPELNCDVAPAPPRTTFALNLFYARPSRKLTPVSECVCSEFRLKPGGHLAILRAAVAAYAGRIN
jgi:hypothetical protein